MDQNPRLSSYTIGVTYSDYISLLLVCGDSPLTSKRGVCWNLLESTLDRIPLIKLSHKWTRMLFIISNSKLGIWICSQPRIDLNSQSRSYDFLTRPFKYLVQHTINTLYKTTCTEDNLRISFTMIHPESFTSRWKQADLISRLSNIYHSIDSRMMLLYFYGHQNSCRLAPTLTPLLSLNKLLEALA